MQAPARPCAGAVRRAQSGLVKKSQVARNWHLAYLVVVLCCVALPRVDAIEPSCSARQVNCKTCRTGDSLSTPVNVRAPARRHVV